MMETRIFVVVSFSLSIRKNLYNNNLFSSNKLYRTHNHRRSKFELICRGVRDRQMYSRQRRAIYRCFSRFRIRFMLKPQEVEIQILCFIMLFIVLGFRPCENPKYEFRVPNVLIFCASGSDSIVFQIKAQIWCFVSQY